MNFLKGKNLDYKANVDEFNEIVDELLKHDQVLKLHDYSQHLDTSRLQHSINVSYYSYLICKKYGWDYKSAARAGILHDFFLYDWREEKQPEGNHAFAHPKVALRNARCFFDLNDIECDAILNHMWPITPKLPRYKESFVVSITDSFSACVEVGSSIHLSVKSKISLAKRVMFGEVLAK